MPAWPSCCGAWQSAASESAVVPSTMLGSRSRNAWPARPRPVAARHILGPAPLRAFHRVPSDVRVRADLIATCLATDRAAVLVIEIDSISQIGSILQGTDVDVALAWIWQTYRWVMMTSVALGLVTTILW